MQVTNHEYDLKCPCGNDYFDLGPVETWFRQTSTNAVSHHVVNGEFHCQDSDATGSPSERESGALICVTCVACKRRGKSSLSVHKGKVINCFKFE